MAIDTKEALIAEYQDYIQNKSFPCIAAKAALARQQVHCFVADHIACPKDDHDVLHFLYTFIDEYRRSPDLYHSAVILFRLPAVLTEEMFDAMLWQRLQALSDLDAKAYPYDPRVSADPGSGSFSFSLMEEAFYIIGLHPANSRPARQFKCPALVFNPHAQFEQLRHSNKYENIKNAVRKRDAELSGSANPMLVDFGEKSEVFQYSGRQYDEAWQCPLKIKHRSNEHNPAA